MAVSGLNVCYTTRDVFDGSYLGVSSHYEKFRNQDGTCIVVANLSGTLTAGVAAGSAMATVPTGFRPVQTCYGSYYESGLNYARTVQIDSDGKIKPLFTMSNGNTVYVYFTYISTGKN